MSKKSILQKKKSNQHKVVAQSKKENAAILQELVANPPPDFELQIGDGTSNEILNGDIQVRWCVTGNLIDVLNDAGVVDPHILLISAERGSRWEMSRQLIPLTQLKTFVRCTKAGEIVLHAWIIDGGEGRKHINRKFMRKVGGCFDTEMLDFGGDGFTVGRELAKYTTLPVVIPPGVFGKEPGPTMKKFVNLWHSKKIVDECNYRQRLIIAFTIKWEAMIIFALVASIFRVFVSLVVAGSGYSKNVNWSIVLRVFDFNTTDIFSDEYGGNWLNNDYIHKRKISGMYNTYQYFFTFIPLIPSVVALLYLVIYMVSDFVSFADHIILLCLTLIVLVKITIVIDVFVTFIFWCTRTNVWTRIGHFLDRVDSLLQMRGGLGWNVIHFIGGASALLVAGLMVYINWDAMRWVALVLGGLAIGFIIVFTLLNGFYRFFTIDETHNNINDVKELLCNDCDTAVAKGESRIVPFPSRQRRIKLLYLETKNKVCKPMQQ